MNKQIQKIIIIIVNIVITRILRLFNKRKHHGLLKLLITQNIKDLFTWRWGIPGR